MKIFAVGNSFYGDDGIGMAVLDRIKEENIFPGAELIDIYTDALSIIDHLNPGEQHVIVDAAMMGFEPGTVEGFQAADVGLKIKSDHLSMHGFGLAEAFAMAKQLGKMPDDVFIVGIEPERIEINQGLSAVVKAAVPRVISIIKTEVQPDE